jgi:uncharacterized protein (TIGR02145 family)
MKTHTRLFIACIFFLLLLISNASFAQPCPNISGRLTYLNSAFSPLYDVQVQLKNLNGQVLQTNSTNYNGQFFFCDTTPGTYILNFISNVNEGGINATDALDALRQFMHYINLNGLKLKAADVNASGYVNSSDALMIAKFYSGMINNFPAGKWIIEPDTIVVNNDPVYREIQGICYGDLDGSHAPVCFQVMNTPCTGLPTITYGGQTYNTVQIGNQCWMKENLNIGNMVTSVNTDASHSECHNNGIIEKYCYNNNPAMCTTYGGLYTWDEMMQYSHTAGAQGICPTGWHIPTDPEWCTLNLYLDATVDCNVAGLTGTTIGNKLKETGTTHWIAPNDGATNESGFTALGAGYRDPDGYFNLITYVGSFWESYEYSTTQGVYRFLGFDGGYTGRQNNDVNTGFSVRCVKSN